jgi:hypothetical protein
MKIAEHCEAIMKILRIELGDKKLYPFLKKG